MKIINHEADGLQISQRKEDGYMNLTQMAKNNGKKINDYLRLDTTKAFLDKLSTVAGIPVTGKKGLIEIRQGGNNKNAQGTWGHPKVAINCAMWCNAEFAVFVTNLVFDWMNTGKNPIQTKSVETEAVKAITDIPTALEELEKIIISIRSHARAVHTCTHQPMDELLAKSVHSLSHNQLSAIASVIHQMQTIKQFAETEWTKTVAEETTLSDEVILASALPPTAPELNTQVLTKSLAKTEDTQPNTYTRTLGIPCNLTLYASMQNKVEALHRKNDYSFTSVTDVIREALKAYQNGMKLTELSQPGKKKQTSIRVDDSLYKFYKSLPNQLRTKIIEKAIRTYIKNM